MGYDEVKNGLLECADIIAIALGGSRSRGNYREDSDYDLFCIISNKNFEYFRMRFCNYLESIPCICCATQVAYLENWGYLYKAFDFDKVCYDISIISEKRKNEMSIRSTNIVLKDTNGIYQECIEKANDNDCLVSKLENVRFYDYGTLFGFERNRFIKATQKKDYWYAVRCLERMKNYLIRCDRIQNKNYPQSRSCPEKGYIDIFDCLKKIYIIDGSLESLNVTAEKLCELFLNTIKDKNIHKRCQLLWQDQEENSCLL